MSKRLSARVSLAALAVGAAALVPAAASAQGYSYGRPGYDARCEQYREGRTGAGALSGGSSILCLRDPRLPIPAGQ